MSDLSSISLKILDDIQLQESRLLSWGMVDGSFTEDELITVAERAAEHHGVDLDPEEAIDWLEDRALIFQLPPPSDGRYRTRVAKGVRLFARLRQLFPDRPWYSAAELVSDFRFATLPRRYPERFITVGDAIAAVTKAASCTDLQKRVAFDLLGGDDTTWKLADFQQDATSRILAEAKSDRCTGTIVCAGTGSGKTLAFYIPTFMHVADRMGKDANTQCLAIYPRIELLRDQLTTAVQNARVIEPLLRERRERPMSIGALYGAVPKTAGDLDTKWYRASWPSLSFGGQVARGCPYFDCPECNSKLGWLDSDRNTHVERLVCSSAQCHFELTGEAFRLTRKSMSEHPPDILFSTTEMLNRGMSNRTLWPILGIGDDVRPPALVLLDEIHTYYSITGAQVGLTLRRWRHLAEATPHFVGLSATLAEAPRFMAELVGLYPNDVAAIEPQRLVTEGCEHIIALRGKPGTATLSTTIQSSMLLRRLMDATPPKTKDLAGERIFVFTDNLDVTNRLYYQLGDAEGWYHPQKRRPSNHPPLASLRSSIDNDAATARFRDGQSWDLVEAIGHGLGQEDRSIVGRTSSQDANVESDANIVVATASLEVGFDDPLVGGVLQHQAPKDPAAYVQRKGRAGRSRSMRPWTVVVLSDWGRDRQAYRSYENLFSPHVPSRHLPIENRQVLRIQAALSFMDWLAIRTPNSNLWTDLSGPGSGGHARRRQEQIENTLNRLLTDRQLRARFTNHLQRSLGLEKADEVAALLWEPPRSLVFSVWPTLLRRLEQQWERTGSTVEPRNSTPLPEYVPRALFEDLNLPEVAIDLGHRRSSSPDNNGRDNDERLPIRQALTEFAPGRVSRRYAVNHALDSHWVPPPETFVGPLDIETFCSREDAQPLGRFQYLHDGAITEIDIFRPYRIHAKAPGQTIHDRSDSRPHWHTQIVVDAPGTHSQLPKGSTWKQLFTALRFHTHVRSNPVEMRRFTTGADVDIREKSLPPLVHEGVVTYQLSGEEGTAAVGLGYSADVDGLVVDLRVPENIRDVVAADSVLLRSFRVALFSELLSSAAILDGLANVFLRHALAETYLTLAVILAERENVSLDQARQRITTGDEQKLVLEIVRILRPTDRNGIDTTVADEDESSDDDIAQLLADDTVRACLADVAQVLSRDLVGDDEPWLRHTLKTTIGGAVLGACQRLCPQVDAGDLFVELSPGPTPDGDPPPDQVWLTESTVGGSGFVEAIQRACSEDPRRFFHLIEAELEPGDFEDVDYYLRILLNRLVPDNTVYDVELADQFGAVRSAETFESQSAKFEDLRTMLQTRGIATSHAVISAIALRLLRPGTSSDTDRITLTLAERRDAIEARHGVELDDRSFAALLASDEQVRKELREVFQMRPIVDDPAGYHALIVGLLWPRGSEVRRQSLAFWNPFASETRGDRLLLHAIVPHAPVSVSVQHKNWRQLIDAALLEHGRAALIAPLANPELLRAATLDLASAPIETDSLLLYPRVRSYKRALGKAVLVFDMPEALQ